MTSLEIALFCSLLCSSDVVAAVSILKYEDQPQIYSMVFGEGIVNDAVSIILFHSVSSYVTGDKLTAWAPLVIIWKFIKLSFISLLIGIAFGLFGSFLTKQCRFLS